GSLGTVGGLLACGLIAYVASKLLWFTGLAAELGYLDLGALLWRTPGARDWPFVDFLPAGLIIAALGAMMDVSMSVSSTIYEVKRANPAISPMAAMRAGHNVGKDIMSTMTDTLIFAFIGADLVFIVMPGLTFQEAGRLYPFVRILNDEAGAIEAIHAIMGTLGLVLAIPISAFIAGLLTARVGVRQAFAGDGGEANSA
ncbi:MAG: YibE/F family protein, partial [Candidatus Poribacteria bacterium]